MKSIFAIIKALFTKKHATTNSTATPSAETQQLQHARFIGEDGKVHKLYARVTHPMYGTDRDRLLLARAGVTLGQCIPVAECSVGNFHTDVQLQGIRGIFNSVHFDFLDERGAPVDIYNNASLQRVW